MIELALTRIFSVTMFYHFAFLAVSVALFGLSASGVFVYITPRLHPPEGLLRQLRRYAAAFWVVTILATIVLLRIRVGMLYTRENLAWMIVIYLVSAMPFAAAGLCLALAMSRLHADINRIYGADLAGAAAGCLLLIPALNVFGGPGALLAAAGLGATASLLFACGAPDRGRWRYAVPIAAIAVALAVDVRHPLLDVPSVKSHRVPGQIDRVLFSKWNSFSRIAVYDRSHGDWGLSEVYTGPRPETRWMDIDSQASTSILRAEHGSVGLEYLRYELTGIAYGLKPAAHALVIGPGGGRDLWTALVYGARRVDGVEVNPIIANDVMGRAFRAYSGDIYHGPGVHVVVDDGRSYVRRSSERYDVIQASLVDTWAATSAGAYTLTENNLYTTEAFVDYLTHLKPDGILTISRWVVDGLRVVSLARAAGERLGWPGVADRLFIASQDQLATFVLKNSAFTGDEVARLLATAARLRFDVLYAPATASSTAVRQSSYTRLIETADPAAFYRAFRADISPTSDDRPFFFHRTKLQDHYQALFGGGFMFGDGLRAVLSLLIISIVLVVVFTLAPLAWAGRGAEWSGDRALRTVAYFGCLGAGYMLIEIGMMQRFVLFLGHPTYSLTVILFTLLLGSGAGSAWSRREAGSPGRALAIAIPAICAAGLLYALLLPPVFTAWIGFARPVRVVLAAALLFPLGFVLGIPLPAGVRLIERRSNLIAWAWAINGATSVLGATLAIFIAMNWGFARVAAIGSIVYASAGLIAWWMWRTATEDEAAGAPLLPDNARIDGVPAR